MATGGAASHDASDVGWLFVSEYYNFVNKQPGKLYQFYNNKSSLIHGHEAETVKLCQGLPEIQARIAELDFQDCKVLVSNVDSQTSMNGGIIVQVLGEMSNKGGPYHKFAQTFFLAQQPNGYFVLNDVFRFLKEEVVDNEYADEVAVEENPVIQEQYVNEYTQKAVQRPEPEVHANHTAAAVAAPVEAIAPAAEVVSEAPVAPAAAAPKSRGSPAKAHHEEKAEKHAAAPAAEEKPAANHVNHAPAAPAKQEAPAAAAAPAPKADTKPKTWAALAANATPAAPKPAPAQTPKKPESRPAAAPAKEAAAPKEAAPAAQQQAPRKEKAHKDDDEALKYSIFVRNVKEGTTADALKAIFASLGGIRNIEVKKAFALIEFTTTEAAKKAIEQNKFYAASGEPLYVEEKKKPGSGGGQRPAPAGGSAGGNAGGNRGGRGNAGGRGGAAGNNNNNGGEKKANNNNKQQAAAPAAAAAADK